MPHKDPEARKAYCRERYRRLMETNPEWRKKRTEMVASYFQKKYHGDEAWRQKRAEMKKRWYDEFGKENAREKYGYIPWEEWAAQQDIKRQKSAAYMREWMKGEKGQRARVARACKDRCGLSIDEYDRVYDEQEGKCKICERECPRYGKGRLVIDHCHKTKTFRALLCTQCNCAIGMFGENQRTFHNAVLYLEEFCEAM